MKLLYLGTLRQYMKNNVSAPSVYLIHWKIYPIAIAMNVVYFVFYGPFMRCQYYCTLPVLGKMKEFICPGYMVTLPVTVFLMYQSYPVWIIFMGLGEWVRIFLGGVIVVVWLAMISCPLSRLSLWCIFLRWRRGWGFHSNGAFPFALLPYHMVLCVFLFVLRSSCLGLIKIVSPFPYF